MWAQKTFRLRAYSRGFHLVTQEVVSELPELGRYSMGILHLFIRHTSASLAINENADPTVRTDFKAFVDRLVPENESYYQHRDEGPDDMPAHLKSSLVGGPSVSLPIQNGRLAMGTWQGIYLCEHRDYGGKRELIATLQGE